MKYLLVIVALFFMMAGCATKRAETISSQLDAIEKAAPKSAIDPVVVAVEWEEQDTVYMDGTPVIFYKNPNVTANIQCAALCVYYNQIIGYVYLDNDHVFFYWFDKDVRDYILSDCDQEQWKQNFKDYCLKVDGQVV